MKSYPAELGDPRMIYHCTKCKHQDISKNFETEEGFICPVCKVSLIRIYRGKKDRQKEAEIYGNVISHQVF